MPVIREQALCFWRSILWAGQIQACVCSVLYARDRGRGIADSGYTETSHCASGTPETNSVLYHSGVCVDQLTCFFL